MRFPEIAKSEYKSCFRAIGNSEHRDRATHIHDQEVHRDRQANHIWVQ